MSLQAKDVAAYLANGYLSPVKALDADEVSRFRVRFDGYTAKNAGALEAAPARERRTIYAQTHLSLPWVHDIVRHDRILDAVCAVLGPDILVWESNWFVKFPHDPTFVSWHQDAAYWGLSPPKVVTAWVALSPSNEANGCLRVVPGSHHTVLPQSETYARDNALSRGQEISVKIAETEAVSLLLNPGEMSLHDIGIAHGSKANASDVPRIGLAIRYIAPEVAQAGRRQYALLVRGRDDYGHFDLAPSPRDEASGRRMREEAERRMMTNIMR